MDTLAAARVEYNEAKDYAKANMLKSRYTTFFICFGNNIQVLLQETVHINSSISKYPQV